MCGKYNLIIIIIMFGNRFKYITLTILLVIIKAQDFSPGPYGINFLDTAGPFVLEDFNVRQAGDIDGNRINSEFSKY